MIKSMTGYGRGTTQGAGDKINVEIKSLNSRYLDIRFLGININPTIEQKVKIAKPMAEVSTPSTAAIQALKKLNIKKVSIFTPYSKKLNDKFIRDKIDNYLQENSHYSKYICQEYISGFKTLIIGMSFLSTFTFK